MGSPVHDRRTVIVRPLSARSVALTALLGLHPPELPVGTLVRIGAMFGIAERTTRVALTRMVAEGDLKTDDGVYRLTQRLLARQARQDEATTPGTRPWDGFWEMAVVTADARKLSDRVTLRKKMSELRLAELREGVWIRPANLVRTLGGEVVEQQCSFFDARYGDPIALANSLWDLPGWTTEACRLRRLLDGAGDDLTAGLMAAAEVLHHLHNDPVLPPELLPTNWPGHSLRRRFAQFSETYAERLHRCDQNATDAVVVASGADHVRHSHRG